MANLPIDFFNPEFEDGISRQEREMAGMTPAQIRKWRQEALNEALTRKYVRTHNKHQDDLAKAIHEGTRLTSKKLDKLIENARRRNGIDADELLTFTLGNTKRNQAFKRIMSPDILDFYLQNIQKARQHFAGGISPRQIINQSRAVDIKRANEQIFMATVFKRQGSVLYFLTNAAIGSKSLNHKVTVELLDFPSFVIGRKSLPSYAELSRLLQGGKVKFDCDCGRHQYWYRYLATIGKYNHGVAENRYPTTRNPQLTGVACKHVLRVMQMLMSGYGREKIKSYLKEDIRKGNGKNLSKIRTARQVEREAQYQADPKKAEHNTRKIEQKIKKQLQQAFAEIAEQLTTEQKYYRLMAWQHSGKIKLSAKDLQFIEDFKQGKIK